MKIALPAQNISIQHPTGEIDPIWYEKLVSVVTALGQGALATTATTGFMQIPTMAGAPTGAPSMQTGCVPMVWDTVNNKLWIYTGAAWKGVVLS
ncbi:MAG: hypothetical protein J2P55_04445 [Rhizobiales bacterium]|nr:hypothetical protein [Hyphomicrobiales bacterium]